MQSSGAGLQENLFWVLGERDFPFAASAFAGPGRSTFADQQPRLLTVDASVDPKGAAAQIESLKARYPKARIAVLADSYDRSDLVAAYRAGANACFIKTMSCGAFVKTIASIINGETVLPPELLPFLADHEDKPAAPDTITNGSVRSAARIGTVPMLSAREKCILRGIVEGDSNKAIARKIEIAEATVKVHVKAILRKIRLSNRTQAAIWAMNNSGLVWSADTEAPSMAGFVAPPPLARDEHDETRRSAAVRVASGASKIGLARVGEVVRKSQPRA